LYARRAAGVIDPAALSEVFARRAGASILGGSASAKGRFSYWAAEPREVFVFDGRGAEPLARLQAALDRYRLAGGGGDLPRRGEGMFVGGWIGYFGYELGRWIEPLARHRPAGLPGPLVRLCFYDRLVCVDHRDESCWLIALRVPSDAETGPEKLSSLEPLLADAASLSPRVPPAADFDDVDFSSVRCNMDRRCYIRAVESIGATYTTGLYTRSISRSGSSVITRPIPSACFTGRTATTPARTRRT
jgi:anthranilate/para-aminobenzoate synthase component I